jgi:hypothetical protein
MPVALTVAKIDSVTRVIGSFEGFTNTENIYTIDLKMDDGNPKQGDIINLTTIPTGGECSTTAAPLVESVYRFDSGVENCTLLYLINND